MTLDPRGLVRAAIDADCRLELGAPCTSVEFFGETSQVVWFEAAGRRFRAEGDGRVRLQVGNCAGCGIPLWSRDFVLSTGSVRIASREAPAEHECGGVMQSWGALDFMPAREAAFERMVPPIANATTDPGRVAIPENVLSLASVTDRDSGAAAVVSPTFSPEPLSNAPSPFALTSAPEIDRLFPSAPLSALEDAAPPRSPRCWSPIMRYNEVLLAGGAHAASFEVASRLADAGMLPRFLIRTEEEASIPSFLRARCRVTFGDYWIRESVEMAAQGTTEILFVPEARENVSLEIRANLEYAASRWSIPWEVES